MIFDTRFTCSGYSYNPLYLESKVLFGHYPNNKKVIEIINGVRKFSEISKVDNRNIRDGISGRTESLRDSSRHENSIAKRSSVLSKDYSISSFETTEFLTDRNGGYYDSVMNDHLPIPALDGSCNYRKDWKHADVWFNKNRERV